jgi:UDP-N-acetylglucosamine acyltransferase
MVQVHPTAVIDPRAELGADVLVGPYAVIGPGVEVGESTEIQAHAVLERDTRIGRGCTIGYGAVLGSPPQDVKYDGSPTRVDIGDETRIREYSTINRAATPNGVTRIGSRCFIMTYVHVAHDCRIGDHVVIANDVQLAGHVIIGDHAWIGGQTPVHQFVRIGEHAFVGGGSRVPQDVPPFARVAGVPLRLYGINTVGLRRAEVPAPVRLALQRAFRLLFNSHRTTSAAVMELRGDPTRPPEVDRLLDFVVTSERGILVG